MRLVYTYLDIAQCMAWVTCKYAFAQITVRHTHWLCTQLLVQRYIY